MTCGAAAYYTTVVHVMHVSTLKLGTHMHAESLDDLNVLSSVCSMVQD